MSHLDGIHFGYDQISSQDHIPLMYDMQEWEGRSDMPILTALNEEPIVEKHNFPDYVLKIGDKPLIKNAKNPKVDPRPELGPLQSKKEQFYGAMNTLGGLGGLGPIGGIGGTVLGNIQSGDILIVLLFMLVLIIAIQVRTITMLDTMLKIVALQSTRIT
jgi:hypothetical protein